MNDSHKNSESIAKESVFNTRKPELVALRERQRNRNRAVAALGVLVVLATAMALMVPAITMARGDLICGMEEHQHSDACYEKVLVCTQEEGEGHTHTDACYENRLICGKDAHTHNDTCYAAPEPEPAANAAPATEPAVGQQAGSETGAANQQPADQPDVLKNDGGANQQTGDQPGVLANGDGTSQQSGDQPDVLAGGTAGTDGATAGQGTPATDVSANSEFPAKTFEANLVEKDGDKEKTVLTVSVDAPEGALPPNTAMKIDGVDAEKVASDLEAAISYDANLKDKAQANRSIAVNIAFTDADNNKVEPAEDVKVKIWSSYVPEFSATEAELEGQGSADAGAAPKIVRYEKPVLVHVLDAKKAKEDGKLDTDGKPMKAEIVNGAVLANWDDEDKTKGREDTFKFEEDEAGTFVIAELMAVEAGDAEGQPQAVEGDGTPGDTADADEKTLVTTDDLPVKHLSDKLVDSDGNITLTVGVDVPDGALPEGATMQLTPVTKESTLEAAKDAAAAKTDIVAERAEAVAVDITFFDKNGVMVEPKADVHVTMSAPAAAKDAAAQDDLAVVHLPENEAAEVVSTTSADPATATAEFDSADFSVYALVYTVDFKWEVNGKTYEFSIPGGGFMSLTDLVEVLGIAAQDSSQQADAKDASNSEGEEEAAKDAQAGEKGSESTTANGPKINDATKEFMADVESVEFSNSELAWLGNVKDETTVGELKKANALDVQYSAELTEAQIGEINAQTVHTGDWALISLKPFTSEETLTVTMKTGEQFVIKVTDAQISTHVLTADGKTYKITVTYDDEAQIPEGSHLEAGEILPGSEQYEKLLNDSVAALGMPKEDIEHIRFFDITIRNGEDIVEPKKAVNVEIHYEDPVSYDGSRDFDVIHFGNEGTEVFSSVVKANEEKQTAQDFAFQTESFSTFAITSIPSQISDLVGKKFVLYIKPGNDGAVLSPESHSSYNGRLRAIPASSDGITITSDEDTLPVWEITNGSENNTYWLSTTYNNQTVYINFVNANGGNTGVSTAPQDLRIRTRILSNGGTQFRFTYNTDYGAVALDLFDGNPSNGFSVWNGGDENNNEYFTLYEVGEPIQRKVTVHFVDRKKTPLKDVTYNGNNSYVTKNEDGTFTILNDWHGATGTISLENDFGLTRYTYANTHLAKNTDTTWPDTQYDYTLDGIIIEPTFTSTGHALQYTTATGGDGSQTTNSDYGQHDFAEAFRAHIPPERLAMSEYAKEGDQDVYVIMDPYPPASSSGGSGSGSGGEGSGGNVQPNSDPVFHKDMVNNYDGTYELSLSVVGKALNESKTPKVNVLLVVDTSSSMVSNTTNYEDDDGEMVYGGTRLAATQVQLRKLGKKLLDRNNLENSDTNDDDIVEVAMVTFDGAAYPNTLNWTTSYSSYQTAVNNLETHRGTDWEDALDAALAKAQGMRDSQPNEPVYVLFFTDGEPSQYRNFHGTWGLENGQETGNSQYGYRYFFAMYGKEASKDEARAIVSIPGVQLYTMFAFGPTGDNQPKYYGKTQFDLLHDTVKYAYNVSGNTSLENKYAFNATSSNALEQAFDEILRQINTSFSTSEVVMRDSFTNLTVAGVNRRENEAAGGFRYWKIPAGGTWENRVPWTNAPPATIDESGGVTWDLSKLPDESKLTLENDVTYVVTFTVWPSQEAYDWVADLNNGIKDWDDVVAAGLENQIYKVPDGNGGFIYEVQTNPQSTVPSDGTVGTNGITYTKTTTETVVQKGQDEGTTTTYTQGNPGSYVKETITYTQNDDGTWTKTIVSEVTTAFNMPDKRMDLQKTDFNVEKYWDVNGKLTELHNFLYHKDDQGNWVSNQKQVIFKISKGYDANGNPKPYDTFGTDGLPLGWQTEENDYDWVGSTTTIEGHAIGTRWQEDLDISFGLMLTEEKAIERGLDLNNPAYLSTVYDGVKYYLLDYGWDYAIDEVYGLNYQFDFRTSVYHPMLINGDPAHVKFTVDNGVWTITEMEKDLTALTGNNILRSELRVQKELLDIDGNRIRDDGTTTFEFTVNLVNADPVFIPHENVESVPWYGVSKTTTVDGQTVTQYYFYQYAPGGVFDHYATEAEATITQPDGSLVLKEGYRGNVMQHGGDSATVTYDGVEYTGYTQATATIHVKAEEDWNIANIPLGTVVTVSEPNKPGYTFVNAKFDGTVIATTTSEDGTHTTEGKTIPAGSQGVIKITNQELPTDLLIFKAALEDGQDVLLGGAQFSLYKWDETAETWLTVSGVTNPFSVDKDTGRLIQDIRPGLYKLHENQAPDGYNVTQDTYFKVVDRRQIVLCDENGNTTTGDGDDAVPYVNEMAKIETTDNVAQLKLTIYNTPGAALPNTGGLGTMAFTIVGAIMVALAAAILVLRRSPRQAHAGVYARRAGRKGGLR